MMKGSLWRRAHFVQLTHASNCKLLVDAIKGKNLKILDVGCGTGAISLELARRGHDVLGLDRNNKIIEIAKRTREKRGDTITGELRFEVADFGKWPVAADAYDVVMVSRVLHDLPNPRNALLKAHHLLKDPGQLVCLEYAYDRMDRSAAAWLYQVRKPLEVEGWYSSPHLPDDPHEGVGHIMHEALFERTEHINTFQEMIRPIKRLFSQETFSWHPYYFWDILTDMRVPSRRIETRLATMVRDMEVFLLRSKQIQPVLFLYKGKKKQS